MMRKHALALLAVPILLFSLLAYSLFPSYTFEVEIEIRARAYSLRSQKLGSGALLEPCSVRRYASILSGLYSTEKEWTARKTSGFGEEYGTHTAEFSLSANLTSDSYSGSWKSPVLRISTPGYHTARIRVVFFDVKPDEYSLHIVLILGDEVEDSLTEEMTVP